MSEGVLREAQALWSPRWGRFFLFFWSLDS